MIEAMVIDHRQASRQAIQFMVLLILGVSLLALDFTQRAESTRHVLQTYLALPIKNLAQFPSRAWNGSKTYFSNKNELMSEVERQSKEIQLLKATLLDHSALEAENRRLKLLFESTYNRSEPVLVARVLDSFIDGYKHEIIIDKGEQDQVFVGQVAVDQRGIVGQITRVAEAEATISLLTDSHQYIPVMIERNLARAIVKGSGYLHELDSLYLPLNAEIKEGDLLVTSGLGGTYPRGYPVATVDKVSRDAKQLFMNVTAKPVANTGQVLEVLLLKNEKL